MDGTVSKIYSCHVLINQNFQQSRLWMLARLTSIPIQAKIGVIAQTFSNKNRLNLHFATATAKVNGGTTSASKTKNSKKQQTRSVKIHTTCTSFTTSYYLIIQSVTPNLTLIVRRITYIKSINQVR